MRLPRESCLSPSNAINIHIMSSVILITGASRGIGAATAQAFAKQGDAVVINYRSDEVGAQAVLNEITQAGGTAMLAQTDIADAAACERMLATINGQLGPVTTLINNAAQFDREPFENVKLEDAQRVLNANVLGPFVLSQLVARQMIAHKIGGNIIHVSSVLAQHAYENRSIYIASKGAVEALTRAMAVDLARHHIRVNCVAPGLIATEALMAGLPDDARAAKEALIPFGRLGEPSEIAAALMFLASPAARYITGVVLPVDGGVAARESSPR